MQAKHAIPTIPCMCGHLLLMLLPPKGRYACRACCAVKGEWLLTYYIAARDSPHGRLLLEDAVGALDGSLSYRQDPPISTSSTA